MNDERQARPLSGAQRTLEGVACRVEPVVTHPAPSQTRTCAMHAYGSSSRASATLRSPLTCWGQGWCAHSLSPGSCPWDTLPGGRLPSRGSLGPHCPTCTGTLRRYDCRPALLGALRLALASPIPGLLPWLVGSPQDAWPGWQLPDPARALGHPVPQSGDKTRRPPALPSSPSGDLLRSQTPVGSSTRALARPGRRPSRACTPSAYTTTLPISGLNDAAGLLAPPSSIRPLTGRHAGSFLTGWLGVHQVGLAP
jgi:hypothetical protein